MTDLVIDDGSPWWLSPNVWVVPKASPNDASPGVTSPQVGAQYLATATVRNQSTDPATVTGVVYFYWANPALAITPANANLIGFSQPVSVNGGGSQTNKAQCATPWEPTALPGGSGHECLVAAVVDVLLPGEVPDPPATLDAPSDPTVAQRNFTLITTAPHMMGRFAAAFELFNGADEERSFHIAAKPGSLSEARGFVAGLPNGPRILGRQGEVEGLGIVASAKPAHSQHANVRPELGRKLRPDGREWLSVVGTVKGGAALINVTQTLNGRVVGGLSVLVVSEAERVPGRES